MEVIRELCAFERRGPGTDAERRAANALATRLRGIGRRAELEPFFSHPQYAVVYLIHAALGIAGSLLAIVQPAVGFALVLFAAASTYLDLNTRLYLVRSLLFRRVSQNVVSPGDRPEAPARLILMAHYDAARTGYIFSRAFEADPPPAAAHPRSRSAPSASSSGSASPPSSPSSAPAWPDWTPPGSTRFRRSPPSS